MTTLPPPTDTRRWFHRTVALTLAVGACVVLLFAVRPGYGALYLTSTLAFLVAGLIWSPGPPPAGGRRARRPRQPVGFGRPLDLARTYRITTAR